MRLPVRGSALALFVLAAAVSCSDAAAPRVHAIANMEIVAGQDQRATVGTEVPDVLTVSVLDDEGHPIAGQIVNFKVTSGGGSVFAGAAATNASGVAKERWTLGTVAADSQRVEARAVDPTTGEAKTYAVFRAVAVADAPAALVRLTGDSQSVVVNTPAPNPLTAVVEDKYGNPVAGQTVAWTVVSGGGSVSPASAVSDSAGRVSTTFTIGGSTAAVQSAQATLGAIVSPVFSATPVAGTATQLVIATAAAGALAGSAFTTQPRIILADANGNQSADAAAVTMTVSGGATTVGSTTVAAQSGVAQFTDAGVVGTVGSYTITYTAIMGSGAVIVSQPLAVGVGPKARWVINAPGSATVGSTITLTANWVDAGGNTVPQPGITVNWQEGTMDGTMGTFSAATTTTDSAGVASVQYTVATKPGQSILAGYPAFGNYVNVTLTRTPGPAVTMAITPPVLPPYGSPMTVVVRVTDAYGNTVPSDTRTVTVALSPVPQGGLAGTTTRAAVAGVATFDDLVSQRPGTYAIVATAAGLATATDSSFVIDAITLSRLLGGRMPEGVAGMATVGRTLYYSEEAESQGSYLRSVDTSGGTVTQVGAYYTMTPGLTGRLFVDGGNVYVIGQTTIVGWTLAGDSLPSNPIAGCAIAEDAAKTATDFIVSCVATNGAAPHIASVPIAGGSPTTIATVTQHAHSPAVAALSSAIYYSDSASGQTIIRDGAGTSIVTGIAALRAGGDHRLLVVGSDIYWGEWSGVAGSGSLRRAPVSGGGPTTVVVSGLRWAPAYLFLDGSQLYFGDGAAIKRVDLGTGAVTTVVSESAGPFTVDAANIYYFGPGPTVRKIPK